MRLLKYLGLFIVYVLSYWVGLLMYKTVLWVIWQDKLGGDAAWLYIWSVLAFIPIGLIYLVICIAIKKKASNPLLRFSLYPIICGVIFVFPTTLIILMNGGNGGSFFSPEAQLMNILFGSAGVTFGLGYGVISKIGGAYESD